jgi:hypothetical protein
MHLLHCQEIIDRAADIPGEEETLLWKFITALHVFLCPDCGDKLDRVSQVKEVMREDFFPVVAVPECRSLEDTIMAQVGTEIPELYHISSEMEEDNAVELSFRRWIIAGLVLLCSVFLLFFGLGFDRLQALGGNSFLLPVGITVAVFVSGYGAMFIGTHIKELSARFGLH